MIKNKFCLVGVDMDFDSLIRKYKTKFVGFFSKFNSKKYSSTTKKAYKENFIEWEQVYNDDYKGTLKSEVERLVSQGKNIIFDVDVVGGINLKKYFGDDSLSIFIEVPSLKDLEERLMRRGTDLKEQIEERINKAKIEISEKEKFDIIIMNDNIQKSKKDILEKVTKFLEE